MRIGALAVSALLLAVGASAQVEQGEQLVGLEGGVAIPLSSYQYQGGSNQSLGTPGPSFGAAYDYMVLPAASLGLDFDYRSFGSKDVAGGTVDAKDWTILVAGKYQFMPEARLRPYFLGGLGVGRTSETFAVTGGGSVTSSGVGFAWAVGLGGDVDLGPRWSAGLEGRLSGLSANLGNGVGAQGYDSFDLLLTARFKTGP